METIADHKSLIDALGGNTLVAAGIPDCTPVRVGQWKLGNRIPPEYWPDVIQIAGAKGLDFVTSDWLMNTFRPRAMPGAEPQADAA